jgi:hypothetical protein
VYKRNRNAYAKLLLEQLRSGRLEAPFDAAPPGSPLPTLPKSLTYAFSKPKSPPSKRTELTPSQELEQYLGRHGGSGTRAAAPSLLPSPAGAPVTATRHLRFAPDASASPVAVAAAHQAAPSAWQASPLAAQAVQLGARLEREAELEWRLAQAEEQLRRQGQLLARTLAPAAQCSVPLEEAAPQPASPLRPGGDPPGGARSAAAPAPRYNEAEIGALLDRAERNTCAKMQRHAATRQQQAQGVPGPSASASRSIGGGEDVAAALAGFERHTQEIKRRLGGDGAGASSPRAENCWPAGAAHDAGAAPLLPPFSGTPLPPLHGVGLSCGASPAACGSSWAEASRQVETASECSDAALSARLRNLIGPAVKHTLKSAAAAAAGRSSADAARAAGPPPRHPRPGSAASVPPRLPSLLAAPRGGFRAGQLAVELGGLRGRLESSLSAMGSPAVDLAGLSLAPGSPLDTYAHSALESCQGGPFEADGGVGGLSSCASPEVAGLSLAESGTPASLYTLGAV